MSSVLLASSGELCDTLTDVAQATRLATAEAGRLLLESVIKFARREAEADLDGDVGDMSSKLPKGVGVGFASAP